MIEAGRLIHRVTLQRANETQGAHGQPVSTWVDFASRVAAEVSELSGRELWNAQQIQADLTMRILLRWLDGVKSKMRVIWHDKEGDRTLSIEVAPRDPEGRKRGMLLLCKEAV